MYTTADQRRAVGQEQGASRGAIQGTTRGSGRAVRHRALGLLDDVAMVLLVAWLLPVAILLIGMPVVLLVRIVLEIAQRI